jgi:ribosomal protein L37AE/L43A
MAFQAFADWAGQYGARFTPHFRQIKKKLRRIDPAHCAVMRLGHI